MRPISIGGSRMLLARPEVRPRPFISPLLESAVTTDADTQSPLSRPDADREEWQKVIDGKLIEWGANPLEFEEEDIESPSCHTIQLAIQLAQTWSRWGWPAPTRVVPDAHAGIVFERQDGPVFETVRLSANDDLEHCLFEHGRLVRREPWNLHFANE
jgi:hypothetical protein